MRVKCLACLLTLVALLALALPAGAAPAGAGPNQTIVPVTFTLTPAQCPQLQTTVTGSGEMVVVTNTRTDAAGVTHTQVSQLVRGTATDAQGGVYRFIYHNHGTITAPPGGFPMQIRMTDMFNLHGTGSASGLRVGFVWILSFAGPDQEPTITPINIRGNPACDPI